MERGDSDETTPKSPEEEAVDKASKKLENAAEEPAEAHEERLKIDEERIKEMLGAFAILNPLNPLDPELREKEQKRKDQVEGIANIYNQMIENDESNPITDADLVTLGQHLKELGLKKNPDEEIADTIAGFFPGIDDLTPEQQQKITDQLPDATEEEEDIPEEDRDQIEAAGDEAERLSGEAEEALAAAMEQLDAVQEGERTEEDSGRREQLGKYQQRVHEIQTKLNKFLHPDEPLKTWSKRGGKLAGYLLLAMFIALILELHWLHNAARTK